MRQLVSSNSIRLARIKTLANEGPQTKFGYESLHVNLHLSLHLFYFTHHSSFGTLSQPTLRWEARRKVKVCLLMKKTLGVSTNVYLRENVRKKIRRSSNFENKGSGVVYARGMY